MTRPRLLFVSPVVPAPSNTGTQMRAFTFLEAMSERYDIHLLMHGRMLLGPPASVGASVQKLCSDISQVPSCARRDLSLLFFLRLRKYLNGLWTAYPLDGPSEWIPLTRTMKKALEKNRALRNFDVIHIFRMPMIPLAAYLSAASPKTLWLLDMDDVESKTRQRLRQCYLKNRDRRRARIMAADAAAYERIEAATLPRFDRIFICSQKDGRYLRARHPDASITVIPNTVKIPASLDERTPDPSFTFVFIGTLNYYPNQDGLLWFIHHVLPLLRTMGSRPVGVNVIGGGLTNALRKALNHVPEVNCLGYVPRVSPWYSQAEAVIVPLRAGGGTRIKVLEAFAHRRPVVSTSLGVEGIRARPEHHFLQADDPMAFARQCRRLMSDPEIRERLARNSLRLVRERYHTGIAHQRLRECWETLPLSTKPPGVPAGERRH